MGLVMAAVTLAHAIAFSSASPPAPSPVLWYVTRALGIAAYVTLACSVILGMMQSIATRAGERISWVVGELHQVMATLAGLLVAGHLFALRFDPFLPFSTVNLLLPVSEPYRPFAVGLGVLSLYAMALLLVSSWLRNIMSYRAWRVVHYVSFAAFILVTMHGWLAGSDTGEPWMHGVYVGFGSAVAFLVFMRLVTNATATRARTSG